ncbi:hypothetical protein JMT66_20345 [Kosakonia cowanii]|uniref:DUF6575 domain-containing protein n=1 Tax=Kosakonia TaxID=1330547 RepID=UPI00190D49CD|nr:MULTISPECIES: DUF6575 domain-containing protein [Kosakonia]MBK0015951.1 hypothetical protein [Kosakonia sp. S42]UGS45633.1 hypothetical protein JMT66_20345 [Kosakonia cowanii]
MYYLPITNELGELSIERVYSFYDVPRTFLVKSSKTKEFYLVYWFDESETFDSWYYAPMNKLEISNLDSGFIQVRDFFLNKNVFIVTTPYDLSCCEIEFLSYRDIDNETLPPVGYFISIDGEGECAIVYNDEKEILNNVHEIRIFRDRSEKNIEWEPIQKIINTWNSLYNKVAKVLFDDDFSLVPYTSSIGSYKTKFIAEKNDVFISNFTEFLNVLKSSNLDLETIKELGIDLNDFEALLSNLRTYNYKMEVRSNTGSSLFIIDAKKLASEKEKIQEHNQRYLSSDLVPQADDIYRVIKLVDSVGNNELFNEESEGITPRQVNYYKHAARLLGLVKKNGFVLQPLGWKVFFAKDFKEKISLLAEAFENSDCGWAWMKYCGVETIVDIDETTAIAFLIEKANGLAEDTAKRRSKTLHAWAIEFKNNL